MNHNLLPYYIFPTTILPPILLIHHHTMYTIPLSFQFHLLINYSLDIHINLSTLITTATANKSSDSLYIQPINDLNLRYSPFDILPVHSITSNM